MRLSILFVAAVAAACAENGFSTNPSDEETSAPRANAIEQQTVEKFFSIIDHCQEVLSRSPYVETFLDQILSAVSVDLEPPYDETAILMVSLGPVGYVENLELKSVSSSAIEAPFRMFVEAPPSLPRAPQDVHACLGTKPFPFIVQVAQNFRCQDQDEYLAYYQNIELMLYKILYSPRYSRTPGHGWVRVSATLGSEGQVRNLDFHGQSDPRVVAKLRAAIEQVGRFPPPPDFSRCFAEKPVPLRLDIQGE